MPTYLHQVVAVARSVDADATRQLDEVKRVLMVGGDQDPLTGLSRTHEPRNQDDIKQPTETRRVQVTAADLLTHVSKALTRLFDLNLTREYANCEARADVVIDGRTVLADVPTGYLLFLETQLGKVIGPLIDQLPVLDPAEEWHDHAVDPSLQHGVWASAPRQRHSTRKTWQVLKLAAATKEHPEQVRPYETDVSTGTWTHIKFSGQLPAAAVQDLRERVMKALQAVRYAREQANRLEVTERRGGEILQYVFGDLIPSG